MLRDYQINICSRVCEAFGQHRSVMVQMPTGTGKTVVLAELVKRSLMKDEGLRILIVAHRRELIEQIKATVKRMGLNADNQSSLINNQKINSDRSSLINDQKINSSQSSLINNQNINSSQSSLINNQTITVESIQTISRRIATTEFSPSLVVIDEAHHALAKTYKMMWDAWPNAKFLGLTATPCRLNGKGFTDLFDVLVQSEDIPTFIKEKWLSTYDFVSIKADSRTQQLISSLKKRGADGDYQVKEMDAVLNKRPSIERLYNCVMEYAHNRKGFVYAINIDHARSIAEYYQEQGVNAVAIDSHTPVKERERLISSFRSGELQVLVNVDIFSEGFDCPDVEFIQLARPTLSLAKYLQMVGRGLRPSKGKKNCMIIDNVGLYRVFGLPSQIWDWKSAFEGRLRMKDYQSSLFINQKIESNQPSLIINQTIDSEMFLVVSHEQLDSTFEQQKKDDVMAKERSKLLGGVYGKVTIVGRQLAELRDKRGEMPTYVDLMNMNWFRHWDEGKPGAIRIGGVEFLRIGNKIISRTRTPITLSYDRERITKCGFYTTHSSVDNRNLDCLRFYKEGFENGSNTVVFLHDEPQEYYWESVWLWDGGLVVMGIDGCYYHVDKGMPKVYLGCADTEENKTRLSQAVHAVIAESEQRNKERKENIRRDVESLDYVKPCKIGTKWGLRGSDGRILCVPKYRSIMEQNDYFLIEDMPLHWGVMDKFGKVLVEPKHDTVEITPDGKAILTSVAGKHTIINLK